MMAWIDRQQARSRVKQGHGLFRDNPKVTAPELLRYDACVSVSFGFDADPDAGIGRQTLPGGAYAVHTHVGSYPEAGQVLSQMHHAIVPKRGLSVDYDRPFLAVYLNDPADHARGAPPYRAVRAGNAGSHAALGQRRRAFACRRRVDRAPAASSRELISRYVTAGSRPETMSVPAKRTAHGQARRVPPLHPGPHRRADGVGYAHPRGRQVRRHFGRVDPVRRTRGRGEGHRQGRRARHPRPGAGLDRRCGRGRGDHHRRHRVHRPRRHARGRQAAVREGGGRLLDRFPHDFVRKDCDLDHPVAGCAGVAQGTYIFCLPGSPGACRDAWNEILKWQLDNRHRPCNFVEIMPRLEEHRRGK